MLWRASIWLIPAVPSCVRTTPPCMYSWPAAHLCASVRGNAIPSLTCSLSLSIPLCPSLSLSIPLYPSLSFSVPLCPSVSLSVPLCPSPLICESQPPATSQQKSESCLGSREMGPAACETTDRRYEEWEMKAQTDTHAHLCKHSRTHTHTSNTHRALFTDHDYSGMNGTQ